MIQQGRADCTINDAASINAYMKANPDADVKIAAYYEPENEYEIQSSVMCRKEDKADVYKRQVLFYCCLHHFPQNPFSYHYHMLPKFPSLLPPIPVSYTHLDVYKRQLANTVESNA